MTENSTIVDETDYSVESSVSGGVTWDRDSENTPVFAIISAVAAASGTDPLDLPPLYEVIDPDALNLVLTSRQDTAVDRLDFQYAGYEVVVLGSGEVHVSPANDD